MTKKKDQPKKTIVAHRKGRKPTEIKWFHHTESIIKYKQRKFKFYGRPLNKEGADHWMKEKVAMGYTVFMGQDEVGPFLYRSVNKTKNPKKIIESKLFKSIDMIKKVTN